MPSIIVMGRTKSREHPLEQAVTVIGRDGGVNLELGDLQISRRHALLVRSDSGCFVKDLGSRNGISLNRERVEPGAQVRLKNGDVLALGRTTLVFKDLPDGGAPEAVGVATRPSLAAVASPSGAGGAAPAPVGATERAPEASGGPPVAAAPAAAPASSPASPPAGETPRSASPPAGETPRPASEWIPRALSPGAARGRGGSSATPSAAELLALHSMVDRVERERLLFRNVALGLAAIVALALLLLLTVALRGPAAPAPGTSPSASSGTPSGGGVGAPGATPDAPESAPLPGSGASPLDEVAYAQDVQPVLSRDCASCHSFVGRGGELVLATGQDAETLRANLAAVRAFVLPGRPDRSPLLLKPLAPEEGGLGHGGGAVWTQASPAWRAVRDWVAAAAGPAAVAQGDAPGANARPTASAQAPPRAVVGERVALDGRACADPDGDALSFRWTLLARPASSAAALQSGSTPVAVLVPDVAGTYTVALVVHDGTAPSETARLDLEVGATPDRRAARARVREALLGRAPDDPAVLDAAPSEADVAGWLAQDDLYRAWWEAELAHLGLVDAFHPRGEPWDSIPRRLRGRLVNVVDALQAVSVGQAFGARHGGREAFVAAVLTRLCGLDDQAATAERPAAERLYDGHEATFLDRPGRSQADLVRIAARAARTHAALLVRAHRRVTGGDLPEAALASALLRFEADSGCFFTLLAEWGRDALR